MIARRALLAGGAALALYPKALGAARPISFRGSFEQGGLVIGQAGPGDAVTVSGKPVSVSASGLFVFGLSYDAETPVAISATHADGGQETCVQTPLKRQYDIQAINGLPPDYVEPPADILERMKREREAIWIAREADTAGIGFSQALEWPCAGRLSGIYGSQRILNGKPMSPHLGVDVAAPEGTLIHAAADGIVAIADDYHLEGGFTLIDHGHGVSTCYLHQSARMVQAGDAVRRGDVIGQIGKTGRATGPHCHWGLCWFQMKLDPSRVTVTPQPPAA
jgi:murein DD-endopeptidase MepM/ murein hydrolase activator NlpD